MQDEWYDKIFNIDKESFGASALEIFRVQYDNNPVYRNYTDALKLNPDLIKSVEQIPFLPVRFFKSHEIKTTSFNPEAIFESSGTTGRVNSRHLIKDLRLYKKSFITGFESFYGPVKDYCIIGLLPSYFERKNSSLIYMVEKLIQLSQHARSGFYLNENEKLISVLNELERQQQKALLVGVTFALLDLAEKFSMDLKHTIIMETGGMKGRRGEMIRPQVHAILQNAFNVSAIHSEYGMTELLSQSYSKEKGIFHCPPWMKVLVRDDEDPLEIHMPYSGSMAYVSGAINIIDLANIYSCSFIATDDVGKIYSDGGFEVLGRMDNSDLRGCSLLYV